MFPLIRNKNCFTAPDTRVFIQFHLVTCTPISNCQYKQPNIIQYDLCNYKHKATNYAVYVCVEQKTAFM